MNIEELPFRMCLVKPIATKLPPLKYAKEGFMLANVITKEALREAVGEGDAEDQA